MDPKIIETITLVLIIILGVVLLLVGILLIKQSKKKTSKIDDDEVKSNKTKEKKDYQTIEKGTVQAFMEFEKIEDDMIIAQNSNKYSMILQCKGVNFDLMSQTERTMVEEGFVQVLNTIRYPIQIYIQTKSADYSKNIIQYRERIDIIKSHLKSLINRYEGLIKNKDTAEEVIDKMKFEIKKQETLLAYGEDSIQYIEKMNLNKAVLQKSFYVIVSYFSSELGMTNKFDNSEIHEFAYQELYNRCQGISTSLEGCRVSSKILDSIEIAELLFVAYNRDEAQILDLRNALKSGFYSLYTTSQDVLEKKQNIINEKIEQEALIKAQNALDESKEIVDISMSDEEFKKTFKKAIKEGSIDILLNSRGKFPDGLIKIAIDQLEDVKKQVDEIENQTPKKQPKKQQKVNNLS